MPTRCLWWRSEVVRRPWFGGITDRPGETVVVRIECVVGARPAVERRSVMTLDATAILDELKDDPTAVLWRGMLVDVGGMSEADFAQYVARWRDDIRYDKSGWFYHDTAGYYAAQQLLPAKLLKMY